MPNEKKNNSIYFEFIGTPVLGKNGILTTSTTAGGSPSVRLNFGVKVGSNTGFVGLYDFEHETVKTYAAADNSPMEFSWADRLDPDIISKVANYRKFRTNIGCQGDEIQEFLTGYDFAQYLAQALPQYQGDIRVLGQFKTRYDKTGTLRQNFDIESVWKRRDQPHKLSIRMPLVYWRDCIDKADFAKTNRITVGGYVSQYISRDDGDKYLPVTVVLDTNVYKLPQNADDKFKQLRCQKVIEAIDTKAKVPVCMLWDVRVVNGADTVEFTPDQLTDYQRDMIDCGLMTLDECKPKSAIRGPRVTELRLAKPLPVGEYADGAVDLGFKASEFEDQVFVPVKDETVADMLSGAKQAPAAPAKEDPPFDADLDEDTLF